MTTWFPETLWWLQWCVGKGVRPQLIEAAVICGLAPLSGTVIFSPEIGLFLLPDRWTQPLVTVDKENGPLVDVQDSA